MSRYFAIERTCDGTVRVVAGFASLSEAREYLRRAAEGCRASNHRRVELDEDALVLVTEYGGDDTVLTFIADVAEGVVA